MNRFKGLDLVDRVPKHHGWRFVTLYRRWWPKPSPRKRNSRKRSGCLRYGCESWTINRAKQQKIDALCGELCCWRRLLRVPWTARRSNQSVLKEINPEYFNLKYTLEGLMMKLKLQYFGHLM